MKVPKLSTRQKMFGLAFLAIFIFSLGIWVASYIKKQYIEIEVPTKELQYKMYSLGAAYVELMTGMGFDVQGREYIDFLRIPMSVRFNEVGAFLKTAGSANVTVIYLSYTQQQIKMPIFWFAYYDADIESGTLISWTPTL